MSGVWAVIGSGATGSFDSSHNDGFASRAAVKKSSQTTSLEAQKKAEQDIRRRRLQDRAAGRGGDDVGAGIASIAKVKAQKASADRSAVPSKAMHYITTDIMPSHLFYDDTDYRTLEV